MGAIVLEGVEKSYQKKMACSDINLSILEGEFFTLLGPSGCGKTTLLRLIAGFIKPDKGRILLGQKDITFLEPEKRQVGMVFQNYALFPFMSVIENVRYGLRVQKQSQKEISTKASQIIEMIGLQGFEERKVSELSGGEQQRVALARSLVVEPKVLLLDEPLSNLDARLREKMRFEIKNLQKKVGITTLFVTHDQTEALTMSDRIAVFNQGHCVQVGTPEEIYTNPKNSFVAGFIGDTNLFKVKVKSKVATLSKNVSIPLERETQGNYISIRPQDIKIKKTDDRSAITLEGCVKEALFNGTWIDYVVEVKEIDFRVTVLNYSPGFFKTEVGERVFLSIDSKCIKVMD